MELNSLYQEVILDHYKHPHHKGLQKGDIVVKLGDSTITDMMSYMRALSAFEKGDRTKVTVSRNGEPVEADVEF